MICLIKMRYDLSYQESRNSQFKCFGSYYRKRDSIRERTSKGTYT